MKAAGHFRAAEQALVDAANCEDQQTGQFFLDLASAHFLGAWVASVIDPADVTDGPLPTDQITATHLAIVTHLKNGRSPAVAPAEDLKTLTNLKEQRSCPPM